MTRHCTMLYVSCGETQNIVRFAMDIPSGVLRKAGDTLLPGAPVQEIGATAKPAPNLRSNGAPLTIGRHGTVLYVAARTDPPHALSYRIAEEDGSLTLIGDAPIPVGTPYIATDRSGHFLLGAAYHANNVWVSRIGADAHAPAPPATRDCRMGGVRQGVGFCARTSARGVTGADDAVIRD